jgi:nicotinamidase-related amidase
MTALVLIDLQRGFFRRAEDIARLGRALAPINRLLAAFARRERPIVVARTVHKPDRSTWTLKMLADDKPAMIEGTDDVADVEGLKLPPRVVSLVKTRRSAFLRTDLARLLRACGADALVLAGAMLEACVVDTARDAIENDFPVRVALDATVAGDERAAALRTASVAEDFQVRFEPSEKILDALQ